MLSRAILISDPDSRCLLTLILIPLSLILIFTQSTDLYLSLPGLQTCIGSFYWQEFLSWKNNTCSSWPQTSTFLQESGYVPPILSPVFMSCYALCLCTGHHSAILAGPLAFTLFKASSSPPGRVVYSIFFTMK